MTRDGCGAPQVIDCNSDVDILKHFTDNWAACQARLQEAGARAAWTACMDSELGLLHEQGCTVPQMEEFLMSIKIERKGFSKVLLVATFI